MDETDFVTGNWCVVKRIVPTTEEFDLGERDRFQNWIGRLDAEVPGTDGNAHFVVFTHPGSTLQVPFMRWELELTYARERPQKPKERVTKRLGRFVDI